MLNQTLTLTHLVWRKGVALVSKRVIPFLELDTDNTLTPNQMRKRKRLIKHIKKSK